MFRLKVPRCTVTVTVTNPLAAGWGSEMVIPVMGWVAVSRKGPTFGAPTVGGWSWTKSTVAIAEPIAPVTSVN